MTDSILVFPPGLRFLKSNGDIVSGGTLTFNPAGLSSSLEVFSDKGLSVSLGDTITLDTGGYPTSDGSAKVGIYTGTAAYKVTLKDSDGLTVFTHDNVQGAPDLTSISAASGRLVGEVVEYMGSTLPSSKWLHLNGKTFGSASSGGTARASDSADTLALFTILWGTYDNTVCHIQDSSGSNTTRGVSAAADFSANKRFPLIDARERMRVGLGTMGGLSSSNRLTGISGSVDGDVAGGTGGEETHPMASGENATHTHVATDSGHGHPGSTSNGASAVGGSQTSTGGAGAVNLTSTALTIASGTANVTNANQGSGTGHNNVPPVIVMPTVMVYAGDA